MDTFNFSANQVKLIPIRAGRERYPVLQVSPLAMDLLHECIGVSDTDISGVTFTPPQAEAILRYINLQLRRARMRGGTTQTWESMRSAVEENRAVSAGRPMVAIMDRSAIQEELDHAVQLIATGDFYLNHVGPEGTTVLLEGSSGAKAAAAIRRAYPGASDSQIVMEIGVRLMRPGRYREMGLTQDEAQDLRESYVDAIVQRHGPERVSEIIRRVESARRAEKGARYEGKADHRCGRRLGEQGNRADDSPSARGKREKAKGVSGSACAA